MANSPQSIGPVFTSSFTWNQLCGPTVACGPSAAGFHGTGFAAANNVTYAAGQPIVNGVGKGCGQCWHLFAEKDAYPSNGKSLGTPVVVKINDQCTDPKYCDQYEFGNDTPLNTGYGKQVHFDLCDQSGVTKQFFGQINAGVALGLAQQVDCSVLNYGTFGSKMGKLTADGSSGGSSGSNNPAVNDALSHATWGNLDSNALGSGNSGTSSSLSPVAAAQPSTTLATVAGGNPSPAAAAAGDDDEYEQDDCEL
ncbi:hypothetical protein ACLMJK_005352 [Lecanora helva]